MILPSIAAAKLVFQISKISNLGAGGTWPGEIALRIDPKILSYLARQLKQSVLIAGTNGKTTTAKMVEHVLSNNPDTPSRSPSGHLEGVRIVHNASGANLLNGITSALIQSTNFIGKIQAGIGVFEVDEASLPLALAEFTPTIVVLLDLFRDQLDRYGEVDSIAERWLQALKKLPSSTTVIINADDPHLAFIGSQLQAKVLYFGIGDQKSFLPTTPHAVDTIYCPKCGKRLVFDGHYLSHLGEWKCTSCKLSHPKNDIQKSDIVSPLPGLYNSYNTMAATLVLRPIGRDKTNMANALKKFTPAFGRQEEFKIDGKNVKIFLSKNPAGFNASLQTVIELGAEQILIVLNDRIPDGRDVSWIWDVDFEMIPFYANVIVSGDRVYDMALRLKYARENLGRHNGIVSQPLTPLIIKENLKEAVYLGVSVFSKDKTLYILPTYSGMLEVRKILSGRKIL